MGKTFQSIVVEEGQEPRIIYGVIMCPNQLTAESKAKVYPTLDLGFKAEPQDGNKYPYPLHYNSHSGQRGTAVWAAKQETGCERRRC